MKSKKKKVVLISILSVVAIIILVLLCFTLFTPKEEIKQIEVKKMETPAGEESLEDFSN